MEDIRMPKDFNPVSKAHEEVLMTNFNGTIDKDVESDIKGKRLYGIYSGWNFNGKVWFEDEKWMCEVWIHHSWMETVISDTTEDLMEEVSSIYGYE